MANMTFNRLIPSFIPIFFELMHHFKRDKVHDVNIKRLDKTQEKLATVEHMMVRLEKKVQNNRDEIQKMAIRIQIYLVANFLVLLTVLLRVFEVI